jgi:hydroxymethylglutaryl-CoA reductase
MDLTNASEFASVVASCVIAGELSLLTALVKHDLVSAHMKFNR